MMCRDGKGYPCPNEATVRIFPPDGVKCCGWMCDSHAQEVLDEYRDKLGEVWISKPIEEGAA